MAAKLKLRTAIPAAQKRTKLAAVPATLVIGSADAVCINRRTAIVVPITFSTAGTHIHPAIPGIKFARPRAPCGLRRTTAVQRRCRTPQAGTRCLRRQDFGELVHRD